MDRFIDLSNEEHHYRVKHLKSNMDRFIVCENYLIDKETTHLKSNMDRFIAFTEINVTLVELSFKIQYG